jgi:pimeloyl-ACP methyl ester carboxylesterase
MNTSRSRQTLSSCVHQADAVRIMRVPRVLGALHLGHRGIEGERWNRRAGLFGHGSESSSQQRRCTPVTYPGPLFQVFTRVHGCARRVRVTARPLSPPATAPRSSTKIGGQGQPIVFSHGWPLSSDDRDNQMLFFLMAATTGWRARLCALEQASGFRLAPPVPRGPGEARGSARGFPGCGVSPTLID